MSNNANLKAQASEWWWAGGIDWFPNLRARPLHGDLHVDFDAKWRSTKLSDFHVLSLVGKLIWPITKPDSKFTAWGGLRGGAFFIDSNSTRGAGPPPPQISPSAETSTRSVSTA